MSSSLICSTLCALLVKVNLTLYLNELRFVFDLIQFYIKLAKKSIAFWCLFLETVEFLILRSEVVINDVSVVRRSLHARMPHQN